MKTVAFFNNKGGVGKTSLVYHIMWMLGELGYRVIVADLDPQANLTSIALNEERLEAIWQNQPRNTVQTAIAPLMRGIGEVSLGVVEQISSKLALVVGDLELSSFEDDLSTNWPKCMDRDERAFRVTTAFYRIIKQAREQHEADICLIDVGPNLGAINRAAMIAADYVVIPAAPDLFSVQGLMNVGPRLLAWREGWKERLQRVPSNLDLPLPSGNMEPIGYVVSRHSVRVGREVKAFKKWLQRLPSVYCESILGKDTIQDTVDSYSDENCLAHLKDYRSLMPMAQEARKPMFLLKPSDGAIGGHQGAVSDCYRDFEKLTRDILLRIGLDKRPCA
jgi:chromosome partitioning protein